MNRVKTIVIWLVILGFLVYAGWQAFLYIMDQQTPRLPLTLRGATYQTKVVSTEEARAKGLSGTKELARDQAMLFVYDTDDKWGIWMKDMNYPIDIIWLDSDKRIIYMVKSAEPSSYPYTTFAPSKPARYVIEMAAGTIERKNFAINDKATFDLSSIQEGGEE